MTKDSLLLICQSSSTDDIKAFFWRASLEAFWDLLYNLLTYFRDCAWQPVIYQQNFLWTCNTDTNFFFKTCKARKGTSSALLCWWNIFFLLFFVKWQGGFCKASLPLLSPLLSSSVTEEMSTSPRQLSVPSSSSSSPPSPSLLPPSARCSSEGHELKLPLGLPLWHPHWVGGVLRHLHDADWERLISLVDMVSHYLAGGKGDNKGS